jgi:hypothetical protein
METSRLQDVKDSDNVEMIDENRAVIRTNTDDSGKEYTLNLKLETEGEQFSATIESNTKEGLLAKMNTWYCTKTNCDLPRDNKDVE